MALVGRLAHSFPSMTLASARAASRIECEEGEGSQRGCLLARERLLETDGERPEGWGDC